MKTQKRELKYNDWLEFSRGGPWKELVAEATAEIEQAREQLADVNLDTPEGLNAAKFMQHTIRTNRALIEAPLVKMEILEEQSEVDKENDE